MTTVQADVGIENGWMVGRVDKAAAIATVTQWSRQTNWGLLLKQHMSCGDVKKNQSNSIMSNSLIKYLMPLSTENKVLKHYSKKTLEKKKNNGCIPSFWWRTHTEGLWKELHSGAFSPTCTLRQWHPNMCVRTHTNYRGRLFNSVGGGLNTFLRV